MGAGFDLGGWSFLFSCDGINRLAHIVFYGKQNTVYVFTQTLFNVKSKLCCLTFQKVLKQFIKIPELGYLKAVNIYFFV